MHKKCRKVVADRFWFLILELELQMYLRNVFAISKLPWQRMPPLCTGMFEFSSPDFVARKCLPQYYS